MVDGGRISYVGLNQLTKRCEMKKTTHKIKPTPKMVCRICAIKFDRTFPFPDWDMCPACTDETNTAWERAEME